MFNAEDAMPMDRFLDNQKKLRVPLLPMPTLILEKRIELN